MEDMRRALEQLRTATGVIVPVHVPEGVDADEAAALLDANLLMLCRETADPSRICLSVDGADFGVVFARRAAEAHGAAVTVSPEPKGKLQALRAGAAHLLHDAGIRYLVMVDQDADHFGNELLNFVRVAETIAAQAGTDRVHVIGRRLSRHRPMGLLRGELEELADRVLLDALTYRAAVTGRPLRMEYAFTYDEHPDFHSGYKLFSRRSAEDALAGEPNMMGVPESCYYLHAVEAVITTEAIEAGAYLGVVNRSATNEQPISTFGLMARERLVADKMIWPCKRLEVPLAFVRQWLDNHIQRLLLHTMRPSGVEELAAIRRLVLEAWDAGDMPQSPMIPPFV